MGAAGERAVAEYLGIDWDESINTFNVADLPPDWQVRWSNRNDVKVKWTDGNDLRVIGVRSGEHSVGGRHRFHVVGWEWIKTIRSWRNKNGKQSYVKDPGGRGKPAIFVPYWRLKAP